MSKANVSSSKNAVIEQPNIFSVTLEVVGQSSLIQNKFAQKTIEEMLRKHMGLSVQKEKKVPSEVIERAIVKNADGKVCIPPTAFKSAMLTASSQIKSFDKKKTQLKTVIFIEGNSIPIKYSRMIPRMDMVRTAGPGKTPDVRFRPCFEDWSARMTILFPESIPVQTIVDLLNRAGSVGVGEWRPEKNGSFGTFLVSRNIVDLKEIEEVRKECRVEIPSLTIPDWAMNAELTPEIMARIANSNQDEE